MGFAYDPKGDGKTVIRGYAGIYYAATPLIEIAAPFNNYRDPAGDLSVTLGSRAYSGTTPTATTASNFNFTNFFAANPSYGIITGLNAVACQAAAQSLSTTGNVATYNNCAPNTVYRQFAAIGINLNTFALTAMPTLTPAQVAAISAALSNATTGSAANFGIYTNADFYGMPSDFKNPQSYQWGLGFQREIRKNLVLGVDWSQVKTVFLERHRDINLPAPSSQDVALRDIYVRANRPINTLGRIVMRESTAQSLYRGLTVRADWNTRHFKLDAFYTWSQSFSDDDNERDASGVLYDNPLNLTTEYWYSKLDRRHQLVANPLIYLPRGFEISSGIRFRSGVPVNATISSTDINGDSNFNERPYSAPGVEIKRNAFRNLPLYDMDLRVQKNFRFSESKRLILSFEIFNFLNRANMQYAGTDVTNYCRTAVDVNGQPAAPSINRCGLDGVTNVNFLNLFDQKDFRSGVANANKGLLNLSNTPGSAVQQMQIGARFYW
ncbi:MAG: hypothetical protein JO314_04910 [Acidobacteria bacterium]|nr:hypothetical protein [Acidobacteriota bacterium]